MRSHFLVNPKLAAACAVAGAATLLNGNCSAQTFVAADTATNSTYAGGWSAGQNGGYGFGAWSFDGTDTTPLGQYQGISSSSPLGTSWTLLTYADHTGLANAGRAISEFGGLQPGQTFETVIENPTGYHFYRGFDIEFMNSTTNNPGGVNTAALRVQVFAYFNTTWDVVDGSGDNRSAIDLSTSGAAGMKIDLTLTSTNAYSIIITPLSDPSAAYTNSGLLVTTNLPINWVDFRLYWGTSSGLTDTTNNFEISSMTIAGSLNIAKEGTNVVLSWPGILTNYTLVSSTNLAAGAVWNPVSPPPTIINGQNVVTNPIAGTRLFYRLEQ